MHSHRLTLIALALTACEATPSMTADARAVDSAAPDSSPGTYAAYSIIGGLDRVRIVRVESATCFAIQSRSPGTNTATLAVPANWAVESVRAMQPVGACNPAYLGPVSNMLDASDATGTLVWQGDPPSTIDSAQATLTFANPPSWCPPSVTFSVTSLAVQ